MANFFLSTPWPGLVAWWICYISDYALTLWGARLYRKGACEKIAFSGSYELTPYYQGDIDKLKFLSRRFVIALLLSSVALAAVWRLTVQTVPEAYSFVLGTFILTEMAVHVRHVRNVFLFRAINNSDAVRGRVEYTREITLQMSSVELLGFSGMYAVMFAFTGSWFILGGAVKCLVTAKQHRRMSRESQKVPAVNQKPSSVESTQDSAAELAHTR